MRLFKFITKELDVKASLLKESAPPPRSYKLLDCLPYYIPACLGSL